MQFLEGFNSSKMANFDFRTYCNTFWIIFGTPKNRQNMDPRTPYVLQKCLKTYKKLMEAFSENVIFANIYVSF